MTSEQTVNSTLADATQTTLDLDSQPMWEGKQPDYLEDCILWILAKLGNPMSRSALRSRVAREPGAWSEVKTIGAVAVPFAINCEPFVTINADPLEAFEARITTPG